MEEIIKIIDKSKENIDVDLWIERWDRMQDAYVPFRQDRFKLISRLVKSLKNSPDKLKIFDIGCGPLSFSSAFLDSGADVEIVGVDYNPILFWLAKEKYKGLRNVKLYFFDIRDKKKLDSVRERDFDFAISSTSLHWLSEKSLKQLLDYLFLNMIPGGYFINIDHMANEDADIQKFVDDERYKLGKEYFDNKKALNWGGFFDEFGKQAGCPDIQKLINQKWGIWEAIEQGLTFNRFKSLLESSGFLKTDIFWQFLNDRIIIAKKE